MNNTRLNSEVKHNSFRPNNSNRSNVTINQGKDEVAIVDSEMPPTSEEQAILQRRGYSMLSQLYEVNQGKSREEANSFLSNLLSSSPSTLTVILSVLAFKKPSTEQSEINHQSLVDDFLKQNPSLQSFFNSLASVFVSKLTKLMNTQGKEKELEAYLADLGAFVGLKLSVKSRAKFEPNKSHFKQLSKLLKIEKSEGKATNNQVEFEEFFQQYFIESLKLQRDLNTFITRPEVRENYLSYCITGKVFQYGIDITEEFFNTATAASKTNSPFESSMLVELLKKAPIKRHLAWNESSGYPLGNVFGNSKCRNILTNSAVDVLTHIVFKDEAEFIEALNNIQAKVSYFEDKSVLTMLINYVKAHYAEQIHLESVRLVHDQLLQTTFMQRYANSSLKFRQTQAGSYPNLIINLPGEDSAEIRQKFSALNQEILKKSQLLLLRLNRIKGNLSLFSQWNEALFKQIKAIRDKSPNTSIKELNERGAFNLLLAGLNQLQKANFTLLIDIYNDSEKSELYINRTRAKSYIDLVAAMVSKVTHKIYPMYAALDKLIELLHADGKKYSKEIKEYQHFRARIDNLKQELEENLQHKSLADLIEEVEKLIEVIQPIVTNDDFDEIWQDKLHFDLTTFRVDDVFFKTPAPSNKLEQIKSLQQLHQNQYNAVHKFTTQANELVIAEATAQTSTEDHLHFIQSQSQELLATYPDDLVLTSICTNLIHLAKLHLTKRMTLEAVAGFTKAFADDFIDIACNLLSYIDKELGPQQEQKMINGSTVYFPAMSKLTISPKAKAALLNLYALREQGQQLYTKRMAALKQLLHTDHQDRFVQEINQLIELIDAVAINQKAINLYHDDRIKEAVKNGTEIDSDEQQLLIKLADVLLNYATNNIKLEQKFRLSNQLARALNAELGLIDHLQVDEQRLKQAQEKANQLDYQSVVYDHQLLIEQARRQNLNLLTLGDYTTALKQYFCLRADLNGLAGALRIKIGSNQKIEVQDGITVLAALLNVASIKGNGLTKADIKEELHKEYSALLSNNQAFDATIRGITEKYQQLEEVVNTLNLYAEQIAEQLKLLDKLAVVKKKYAEAEEQLNDYNQLIVQVNDLLGQAKPLQLELTDSELFHVEPPSLFQPSIIFLPEIHPLSLDKQHLQTVKDKLIKLDHDQNYLVNFCDSLAKNTRELQARQEQLQAKAEQSKKLHIKFNELTNQLLAFNQDLFNLLGLHQHENIFERVNTAWNEIQNLLSNFKKSAGFLNEEAASWDLELYYSYLADQDIMQLIYQQLSNGINSGEAKGAVFAEISTIDNHIASLPYAKHLINKKAQYNQAQRILGAFYTNYDKICQLSHAIRMVLAQVDKIKHRIKREKLQEKIKEIRALETLVSAEGSLTKTLKTFFNCRQLSFVPTQAEIIELFKQFKNLLRATKGQGLEQCKEKFNLLFKQYTGNDIKVSEALEALQRFMEQNQAILSTINGIESIILRHDKFILLFVKQYINATPAGIRTILNQVTALAKGKRAFFLGQLLQDKQLFAEVTLPLGNNPVIDPDYRQLGDEAEADESIKSKATIIYTNSLPVRSPLIEKVVRTTPIADDSEMADLAIAQSQTKQLGVRSSVKIETDTEVIQRELDQAIKIQSIEELHRNENTQKVIEQFTEQVLLPFQELLRNPKLTKSAKLALTVNEGVIVGSMWGKLYQLTHTDQLIASLMAQVTKFVVSYNSFKRQANSLESIINDVINVFIHNFKGKVNLISKIFKLLLLSGQDSVSINNAQVTALLHSMCSDLRYVLMLGFKSQEQLRKSKIHTTGHPHARLGKSFQNNLSNTLMARLQEIKFVDGNLNLTLMHAVGLTGLDEVMSECKLAYDMLMRASKKYNSAGILADSPPSALDYSLDLMRLLFSNNDLAKLLFNHDQTVTKLSFLTDYKGLARASLVNTFKTLFNQLMQIEADEVFQTYWHSHSEVKKELEELNARIQNGELNPAIQLQLVNFLVKLSELEPYLEHIFTHKITPQLRKGGHFNALVEQINDQCKYDLHEYLSFDKFGAYLALIFPASELAEKFIRHLEEMPGFKASNLMGKMEKYKKAIAGFNDRPANILSLAYAVDKAAYEDSLAIFLNDCTSRELLAGLVGYIQQEIGINFLYYTNDNHQRGISILHKLHQSACLLNNDQCRLLLPNTGALVATEVHASRKKDIYFRLSITQPEIGSNLSQDNWLAEVFLALSDTQEVNNLSDLQGRIWGGVHKFKDILPYEIFLRLCPNEQAQDNNNFICAYLVNVVAYITIQYKLSPSLIHRFLTTGFEQLYSAFAHRFAPNGTSKRENKFDLKLVFQARVILLEVVEFLQEEINALQDDTTMVQNYNNLVWSEANDSSLITASKAELLRHFIAGTVPNFSRLVEKAYLRSKSKSTSTDDEAMLALRLINVVNVARSVQLSIDNNNSRSRDSSYPPKQMHLKDEYPAPWHLPNLEQASETVLNEELRATQEDNRSRSWLTAEIKATQRLRSQVNRGTIAKQNKSVAPARASYGAGPERKGAGKSVESGKYV